MIEGTYECEKCLRMVVGCDLLEQVVPSMTGHIPVYSCPYCEHPMFYVKTEEEKPTEGKE